MNKNIRIAGLSIAVCVLVPYSTCATVQPAVFVHYKQQLSAELAAINEKICSTFSMTHLGWILYKKTWKWSPQYAADRMTAAEQLAGKPLSPRYAAIVQNLFTRLHIKGSVYNAKDYIDPCQTDPAKKDPNLYYGTSDGNSVYIDEETMTRYGLSDAEVEATILHELVHNAMEYNSMIFAVQCLLEKYKKDAQRQALGKKILKELCHLHEKIADIFGGLAGGLCVVQGFISEYGRGFSDQTDTHPASAERVAYMRELYVAMQVDPYYGTHSGYGNALYELL
jgi:hypothetical protein